MENIKRYNGINFCIRCGGKMHITNDREKKPRPKCEACGWIYYKNSVPAVSCLVINESDEVLFIKRRFEPRANQWALPSGYIEIWQTPEEAVVEELHEETGLIGEIEEFLGYYYGNSPIYEKVLSLGYKMKITGGTLQAGDDASEAKFFSKDNMPAHAFWAHKYFLEIKGINSKLSEGKDEG